MAPYATLFFLLVMFLTIMSLLPTPGLPLQLPRLIGEREADDLPGTDHPTISVAVDANGRFYFENQLVDEAALKARLRAAVQKSREPLTLVIQADESVSCDKFVRLTMLAHGIGIQDARLAVLQRIWGESP
ncbi:MAG TPA: biopolymer transporter ExbD [Verrucomicrobiae bacterium]